MTSRASLVAALAARPTDETRRQAFARWLEGQGEHARAALLHLAAEAARAPRGSPRRASLLDQAEDLLATHEAAWLGPWRERLMDWDFAHGLLRHVRLSAATFQRHGRELFRQEPVATVELVDDANQPLAEEDVHAVVGHPAFGYVRDCVVVPHRWGPQAPLHAWFTALAANPRITRLRRFGPVRQFCHGHESGVASDGLDEEGFAALCAAPHLHTLRTLSLRMDYSSTEQTRPWLVPLLARASFAGRLRSLTLHGCGLTPEGLRQLATDPVFRSLHTLDLTLGTKATGPWEALFHSATLTAVRSLHLGADLLPAYARSPMAGRVRDLTVVCADDLDRDLTADVRAWLELLQHAPPPRRLVLECHNPGAEVFAAMRQSGWLRRVRELEIRGDSQYEVYSGRTEGIRSLFDPAAMPRLTALTLHEACDAATLATLASWPGVHQLEALVLTDDYHGRIVPRAETPFPRPRCLRTLHGVVLITEEDVEQFPAQFECAHLSRLHLSFSSAYDPATRAFHPRLTPPRMEQVLRSPELTRVTDLTLGFHFLIEEGRLMAQVLADPAVMPRLKRARIYSAYDVLTPVLDGLRRRLGFRLDG